MKIMGDYVKNYDVIGQNVVVVAANRTKGALVWMPSTTTFTGTVVAKPSWLASDYICISSGDRYHPVRMIKHSQIVSINDVKFQVPVSEKIDPSKQQTWQISSSGKNASYTVSLRNGSWNCNCVAGNFGKTCRHVKQAQALHA